MAMQRARGRERRERATVLRFDEILVDGGVELVPAAPAPGWREAETVVDGSADGGSRRDDNDNKPDARAHHAKNGCCN